MFDLSSERIARGGGVHQVTLAPVTVTRYRCTSCGNVTRFDVEMTRRTRAFHHYTVGGELEIEDVQVLAETIESVQCRWCGPAGVVEPVSEVSVIPPS